MPTAFRATFGKGGPVIASYAEYDAVPGNSQDPVPYEKPRAGVHKYAAGHTDPHSALGLGALGGVLGAKAAMEKHELAGTIVFFGEPAEKVCGSKPVHAAHGFYDGLDACISFHPAFTTTHANTVIWDTHCGSYWSRMYSFECPSPELWAGMGVGEGASAHVTARAPGAIDAVCLMYMTSKMTKEAMLPHTGTWTISEAILAAGQGPPTILAPARSSMRAAARHWIGRERIYAGLDNNAEHVARSPIAPCGVGDQDPAARPITPSPPSPTAILCWVARQSWGEAAPSPGDQKNPAQPMTPRSIRRIRTRDAGADEAGYAPFCRPGRRTTPRRLHGLHVALPHGAVYVGRATPPHRTRLPISKLGLNALGGFPATIDPRFIRRRARSPAAWQIC
jgi:hypothetical protein